MNQSDLASRRHPLGRTTAAVATLAGLVAALVLGTAGAVSATAPSTTSATTATAPAADADTGWVRAGHLSPATPKADITLTPFSGGDPVTIEGVSFSDITDYARVPVGIYTLAIRPAGEPEALPMVSASVRVDPGTASTVIATGEDGPVDVQVIDDDLTPPTDGEAKVRLISAASTSEPVTASVVDGPVLASEVTTGSATGYAEVAAQTWDIDVVAGDATAPASSVPVEAGGVYTLLVLGNDDDGLTLSAVQDSAGSGQMPTGGVDTGAGGLADAAPGAGAGSSATTPAVLAAGALLLVGAAFGATRLRRERN